VSVKNQSFLLSSFFNKDKIRPKYLTVSRDGIGILLTDTFGQKPCQGEGRMDIFIVV